MCERARSGHVADSVTSRQGWYRSPTGLVGSNCGLLLGEHPVLVQRRRLHDEYVADRVLHDVTGDRSSCPSLGRLRGTGPFGRQRLVGSNGLHGCSYLKMMLSAAARSRDACIKNLRLCAANDRHDVRPRATPSRFAYRSMGGATVCARVWQWRRESTTLAGTRTTPCRTGRKDGSAFSPKSRTDQGVAHFGGWRSRSGTGRSFASITRLGLRRWR